MIMVLFFVVFVGVLFFGWVVDLLVCKGFLLGFVCKMLIICGLLIFICIMGVNYINDLMMIMCLMVLVFFGNGFVLIIWLLVFFLVLMCLIGLIGGVFNFVGGLGGIIVLLVVGYLVQGYGFVFVLVYIFVVVLIGVFFYILLMGDVKCVG